MSIIARILNYMSVTKPLKSTCKGNACKNGEDCSICLTVVVTPEKKTPTRNIQALNKYMTSNPKSIRLEKCQHVFHRKCLQDWIYSDDRKNGTRENNKSNEGQKYINGRTCPLCRRTLSKMDFDKLLFTKQEIDNYLNQAQVEEALAYIVNDSLLETKQDPNKNGSKAFKSAFKEHHKQYEIIQDFMRKIYRRAPGPGPKSQGNQIHSYLRRESAKSLRFVERYKYMPGINTSNVN
jgi:hypothetical protein